MFKNKTRLNWIYKVNMSKKKYSSSKKKHNLNK